MCRQSFMASNCLHLSFHTAEKASSDLVIPGDGGRWEPAGGRLPDRVSLSWIWAEDPVSPLRAMLLMHADEPQRE